MSDTTELTRGALAEFPLPPIADTDKDDHGRLLVVAGSREVPGSALLCARAAFRSGAGKVRITTAASVAPAMALHLPEALVVPLPETEDGGFAPASLDELREGAGSADGVVAGPGMAPADANGEIASMLLGSGKPLVLDAALLRCLAPLAGQCRSADLPPVLLPHSREMASLLDLGEEEVEKDRLASALKASERYGAVVVAKGAQSHVVAPDGRSWTYRGGAPGLGVSGSGDTLAGIVGGLLARGADPVTALLWGVLLHGEAGERLSKSVGPVGFMAGEIPDQVPALLAR